MATFNEIINGTQPVLVDFFAEWCGPCKMMAPELEKLAAQTNGMLSIIKVDVDRNPAAATHYGVQGVPTLALFKEGKIVWRKSGAMPAHLLWSEIKPFVN